MITYLFVCLLARLHFLLDLYENYCLDTIIKTKDLDFPFSYY